MSKLFASLGVLLLCSGAVACAATTEEPAAPGEAPESGEEGGEATAEDDLTNAGIKSIEVRRSTGFRPPPRPGSCWPSGSWAYDYTAKKLTGNACVAGKRVTLDKTLSDADHERVRKAIAAVRVGPKPAACPTDMPVSSLVVKRAKSETNYVDQRAACGGGAKPVKEGLSELVTLMEDLSGKNAAGGPCVRTGCSGQICADSHRISTCEMRPQYACYQAAICERGADGTCGFRQTPQLEACLAQF